ncbi:PREDICTED: membrane-associated phosphatidylinositol transfer protein 1, partial [Chaetura pelagica]|uniref:membrane-associated phosphatidylinositol transfer protein 1 n=1 Tax=Chaetura pelagica TaxID=8897 RepID=UPI0005236951
LSPYSHDRDSLSSSQDHIPLAGRPPPAPPRATSSASYQHAVGATIARANQAYGAFLRSGEGAGFCGQVVLLGDCVGGILGFDALCQGRAGAGGSRSSSRRGSLVSAGTLGTGRVGMVKVLVVAKQVVEEESWNAYPYTRTSWFRALLPKAALQVEEESWNAYPYTRTRYTCPFVEKFSIEIETYYRPDAGQQTNIFNLSAAEKRQRILDTIDIVRDPISPGEYKPEEDPKLYHSTKTGRGPLGDDWLEAAAGGPLMCAYKLCKVEFRYWGMQSKIEQFIHDVGLRKVMLRAHRQAWCWQDEWTDLTMEDIRQLEEETARMLAKKMAKCGEPEEPPSAGPSAQGRLEPGETSGQEGTEVPEVADASPDDAFAKQWSTSSRSSYSSQHGGGVSPQSLSEWRMQNIARDSENSSEEEFFDAHEDLSDSDEVFTKEMTKWSSNDFLDTLERPAELDEVLGEGASAAKEDGEGLGASSFPETLTATFDAVTRVNFPEALGHVALRLVPCPPICAAAYALVSKYVSPAPCAGVKGAAPPWETTPGLQEGTEEVVALRRGLFFSWCGTQEWREPISPELCSGRDPLAEGTDGAAGSDQAGPEPWAQQGDSHHHSSSCQRGPAGPGRGPGAPEAAEGSNTRLEFKVSGFFLFGSPLGLVLALRKTVMPALDVAQLRPACEQIYNLFHAADPCASRLEPLLAKAFHAIPPLSVPRYQKYPLGDGTSSLLEEALQTHSALFLPEVDMVAPPTPTSNFGGFWRANEPGDLPNPTSTSEVVKILERWWGSKRMDYSLYCPDALTAFPTITLPHLFHASYWESSDVVAFILRQVVEKEGPQPAESEESSIYSPAIPREKWQRRRTPMKIRNVTANHRASDVIVCEGKAQVLSGRFTYGPLDVVTLTGEKVDIYIMTQPFSGKWLHYGTEVTSNGGRLTFTIPPDKALAIGIYPVRMVVRGDHSYAEAYLTVVARGTESVVFSIDGSFTASVSIMGSDPKVRAGAVDVVRHWQDLGYMIIYVTGRPDMQKHRVVAWLSQHNFPHGVVSFCDGLTHDPLRQKAAFLQSLRSEAEVTIIAGYGSTKDVSVYSSVGLAPAHIYIVGRAVKKFHNQCQFLSEGYVAHLAQLEAAAMTHSPKGPPRPMLGKGTYGCPAPVDFLRKQSQLLRSRGSSQAERDGGQQPGPSGLSRAKPRSISLKLEGEE